jgi:glycosyltransferase involved in cell wall biosynthesis
VKILYLSGGYSPHDYRFLRAIAETADWTYFGRLDTAQVYESRALPQGVEEVSWGGQGGQPAEAVASLKVVLDRVNPDLVHAGPIPSVARYAAQSGFSPLISMSWGSDILVEAQSDPARSEARSTLAHSSLAFADCQIVKQELIALGMPAERIVVFPWGVELDHFSPRAGSSVRAKLGWEEHDVVLSTRSLEPQYGVEVVVDSFIKAAAENLEMRLLLLGRGSLHDRLQEKLAKAGMLERVHFAGHIEHQQLPVYYCAADLYVTASQSDGSSISLLEAMACSLPTLVSDIPGNREWVGEEETGWLFPVGDTARLSQGLLDAFSDPDRLEEMGEKARLIAEERADWNHSVEVMQAAYRSILSEAS